MPNRSIGIITRRGALLAGAGAVAAPFVLARARASHRASGPIRIAGLVSLTGGGSPFGPQQPHRASGGGGRGERRRRRSRPQDRIPRRGRPDQSGSRRARRAQADRRRQGLRHHERVGVGRRQRRAAAVLGEQGDAARHLAPPTASPSCRTRAISSAHSRIRRCRASSSASSPSSRAPRIST